MILIRSPESERRPKIAKTWTRKAGPRWIYLGILLDTKSMAIAFVRWLLLAENMGDIFKGLIPHYPHTLDAIKYAHESLVEGYFSTWAYVLCDMCVHPQTLLNTSRYCSTWHGLYGALLPTLNLRKDRCSSNGFLALQCSLWSTEGRSYTLTLNELHSHKVQLYQSTDLSSSNVQKSRHRCFL